MILLTGATGFIGRKLSEVLSQKKISFEETVRQNQNRAKDQYVFDLCNNTSLDSVLKNKRVIIHAAGLAHADKNEFANLLAEYRRVNVDGTLNLARQAASAGIKRFIFISSISVCGDSTPPDKPFTTDVKPAPKDITGISKLEVEQGLRQISADSGMEVVIIRSPLVYGFGVKGNFASLIRSVEKGLPLPLGAIHNQRSFVAIDNLVDLIITCIDHQAAANQLFFAGDGQDLSTTELLRGVAKAAGKPSRLIPVPSTILRLVATVLGKKTVADRLLGSLQVDISKAQTLLDWQPSVSVEEGLRRCFADKDRYGQ